MFEWAGDCKRTDKLVKCCLKRNMDRYEVRKKKQRERERENQATIITSNDGIAGNGSFKWF